MANYDRPTNMTNPDPSVNPAATPTSANQTVVHSGGGGRTFILVAVLAAILVALFLAFGGAFRGNDTAVVPETGDNNVTVTPAPATPDAGGATGGATTPAPEGGATNPAPDAGGTTPAPEGGATNPAPDAGTTTTPAPTTPAPAPQ